MQRIPIHEPTETSPDAEAPIVTYGPTLARVLDRDEARRYFAGIDSAKVHGIVHVIVAKSHIPGQVNVECWLETITPGAALVALQIADERLHAIHDLPTGRVKITAVPELRADSLRRIAADLVMRIRSRRPAPADMQPSGPFTLALEDAIRETMTTLITAVARASIDEASGDQE